MLVLVFVLCAILKKGVNLDLSLFALDLKTLKEESQELNEEDNIQHEKYDFITGEKSFSCSHTEKTSQKRAPKTIY